MSRSARQVVATVATVAVLVALWWVQSRAVEDEPVGGRDRSTGAPAGHDEHGLPYVDLAALPPEAERTVRRIDEGGPFPYPGKDGSAFGNFEGLLPDRNRGYYAEYTVPTPGVEHRGARRIVAGDGGELYWTEDHYESFERIRR